VFLRLLNAAFELPGRESDCLYGVLVNWDGSCMLGGRHASTVTIKSLLTIAGGDIGLHPDADSPLYFESFTPDNSHRYLIVT